MQAHRLKFANQRCIGVQRQHFLLGLRTENWNAAKNFHYPIFKEELTRVVWDGCFLKIFEEMKVQQWAATKDEGDDAEGTWKTEDSNL